MTRYSGIGSQATFREGTGTQDQPVSAICMFPSCVWGGGGT